MPLTDEGVCSSNAAGSKMTARNWSAEPSEPRALSPWADLPLSPSPFLSLLSTIKSKRLEKGTDFFVCVKYSKNVTLCT